MATRGVNAACLLLFHGLVADRQRSSRFDLSNARFDLPAARFARCLRRLQAAGRTCPALPAWWTNPQPSSLPQPLLGFDDGRESDYRFAFPLLCQASMSAVFFVNTALIGSPGYLCWNQMREMQRAGLSFQSHGHEHVPLTLLSLPELSRQLSYSRQCLQDRLGEPVEFLAAPYGFWNRRVLDVALASGYRALCTSQPGLALPGSPLLPRNCVLRHTSELAVAALLRGSRAYLALRWARAGLLAAPRRLRLYCSPQRGSAALQASGL